MKKEDVLKYSQQIISFISDEEYNVANGFFVIYNEFRYFITANHAITYDEIGESKPFEEVYLILHINGQELTTKAIKLSNWQTIDLYKFIQTECIFPRMELDEIEDVVFCSIYPSILKGSIKELPFRLKDAQPNSCNKKEIYSIPLSDDIITPNAENNYYLAGKILQESTFCIREYVEYFYEDIKFIDKEGKFYTFKMPTHISMENIRGLSGAPIFDGQKNCIGMAIKYRPDDDTLIVLPIEEIIFYLKNYCMPDSEY